MGGFRARRMTLADIPGVMAIEAASFPVPWSVEAYRFEIADNPNAYCIVVEDTAGALAGFAVLWMLHDEAHVGTIASAPAFRQRGVGELLLLELMAEALRRDAIFITLEVRVSNAAAQALYGKHGFVEVGRRKRYYPNNREDALIMTVEDFRAPERVAAFTSALAAART